MKSLALGLMSGTSGDGISAVLARFTGAGFKTLGYATYPYKPALSSKLRKPEELTLPEISSLNFEIGEANARAALRLLRKCRVRPENVGVIGSHGQTIFHDPSGRPVSRGDRSPRRPPSTLQIGESSVIAERTGVTVVSDFRPRDIAAGGQGAPLVPFFDRRFFGSGFARSMLNIGGIANTCVVGRSIRHPVAFDTGPGNCLMDWAATRASKGRKHFDANGALAAVGTIDLSAVSRMAAHPYFSKNPPKSSGRELFNESFIPKELLHAKPGTLLATLTYFTAFTIFVAHERLIFPKFPVQELVVSGGGVFNKTLMDHLRALFRSVKVRSISDFGIHPQAKEPLAFAYFAAQAASGKINHLPSGTGAKGVRILGKITPGARFKGIR